MKLTLEASELKPGSGRGNLSSRLVFTGERWQAGGLCIRGWELRGSCGGVLQGAGEAKAEEARLNS